MPIVEFQTSKGRVVIELFEQEAPNTVANFISLIEKGFYNGIDFHRVIPNFMAQGGDPLTKNENPNDDGTGGPGYVIDCECYKPNARKHFAGSLSMAHAGKDSGGSQFFLTHLPTFWLNADAQRQSGHTVFGRVVQGLDIARSLEKGDTIESAKVLRKRDHEYKPVTNSE
ncbi:peptidylprolyl isomerase [Stratiformator vulcanicus]|uniref:peptidylprolyl isomerase n=1 Tax=Stratiformator vulcanicus TaxID=2527980 RepID=UPI0035C75676